MEKIWLKSYPPGVPAELPTPQFKSVREMIGFSFHEYADRPAYTNMGTTLTYADVDRLSLKFACYLQKNLHLTRGELFLKGPVITGIGFLITAAVNIEHGANKTAAHNL